MQRPSIYKKTLFYLGSAVCGAYGMKLIAQNFTLTVQAQEVGPNHNDMKLKNVHILFRHGARTPIKLTPNVPEATYDKSLTPECPYVKNYKITYLDGGPRPDTTIEDTYRKKQLQGGAYPGQLSTLGFDQMVALGMTLRKRYIEKHGLVESEYRPDQVFIRSSNIARTIDSLRCVMAGVFGEIKDKVTIPVANLDDEILFPNHHFCIAIRLVHRRGWKHADEIEGYRDTRFKIEKILDYVEGEGKGPVKMNEVRDDLVARIAHGLQVPEKLLPYLDEIDKMATLSAKQALCGTPQERDLGLKLAAGPILHMLEERIDNVLDGKSSQRLCLYSVHDSSLVPVLVALGIYDDKWPPYAADLCIEVYEDQQGTHWIRVTYCGNEQTLPGCSGPVITLEEYKKATSNYSIPMQTYWHLCDNEGQEKPSLLDRLLGRKKKVEERRLVPEGM
ncbi:lysophosphatidic acid phosphatase type 6 [Lingula anatina]|uniref:Lysophosphatidic acid phosphatase type 6 n=1 Tax=Lingula anatina TaxID=7574 RepID=A0A1S3HPK8_LINAN|nr:lysophosphatidic acid phosphatase type 6 [Lingula anatina]XP_013387987.1 lysophosphatidic acid phosphatase type 6 [Lingula anatina]XP_013387988.1 lysophosphatidic acid phosphatase type 6 [Lingula anatina]|eukprot:XP_013387986.1 lysophosphatidic acid phosphatase type 6 [Lingula anatina]